MEHADVPDMGVEPTQLPQDADPVGLTQWVAAAAGSDIYVPIRKIAAESKAEGIFWLFMNRILPIR
jgi:hypothetical protein